MLLFGVISFSLMVNVSCVTTSELQSGMRTAMAGDAGPPMLAWVGNSIGRAEVAGRLPADRAGQVGQCCPTV